MNVPVTLAKNNLGSFSSNIMPVNNPHTECLIGFENIDLNNWDRYDKLSDYFNCCL